MIRQPEQDPDNITGIKPEDVKPPDKSLDEIQRIAQEIVDNAKPEKDEQIEVHDSELAQATNLLAQLQDKYGHLPGYHFNLTALRNEARERFGRIGLEVEVTWVDVPTIEVIGRTTTFEAERQYHDVKKGVADKLWDNKK